MLPIRVIHRMGHPARELAQAHSPVFAPLLPSLALTPFFNSGFGRWLCGALFGVLFSPIQSYIDVL